MSDDLDDDLDGVDDTDVDDQGDNGGDKPVSGKSRKKSAAVAADVLEGVSLEAKERERERLARQMEAFMASGGKVQEIDANVVSDPPRKPVSKYGSRPI